MHKDMSTIFFCYSILTIYFTNINLISVLLLLHITFYVFIFLILICTSIYKVVHIAFLFFENNSKTTITCVVYSWFVYEREKFTLSTSPVFGKSFRSHLLAAHLLSPGRYCSIPEAWRVAWDLAPSKRFGFPLHKPFFIRLYKFCKFRWWLECSSFSVNWNLLSQIKPEGMWSNLPTNHYHQC